MRKLRFALGKKYLLRWPIIEMSDYRATLRMGQRLVRVEVQPTGRVLLYPIAELH